MKAIMYHYVRGFDKKHPYFIYLDVDNFRKQLDFFSSQYGFVDRDSFLDAVLCDKPFTGDGVILTFDDGFRDHYDYVMPELVRRNLWGIFYPSTGIFRNHKVLDVHRIHLLLGRHSGVRMLKAILPLLDDSMLVQEHMAEFKNVTYRHQHSDQATTDFKRILNYFVAYEHRENIIDLLEEQFEDVAPKIDDVYMSINNLQELHNHGMLIGNHTVNHLVLSKLNRTQQESEILDSFRFLEQQIENLSIRTFCYPYGGYHTFNSDTIDILTAAGCSFSFNVEYQDITPAALLERAQTLPRYDCNCFPHGASNTYATN